MSDLFQHHHSHLHAIFQFTTVPTEVNEPLGISELDIIYAYQLQCFRIDYNLHLSFEKRTNYGEKTLLVMFLAACF